MNSVEYGSPQRRKRVFICAGRICGGTIARALPVLEPVGAFLSERGLTLHPQKTRVARLEDGFTFLSREYLRKKYGL